MPKLFSHRSRCAQVFLETTTAEVTHDMDNNNEPARTGSGRDDGFTLVELLIVIVILGILATVTVFAVRGITDKGTASACASDKKTLEVGVESYFAQYGGAKIAHAATTAGNPEAAAEVALPAGAAWTQQANAEATLKAAGYLRDVSPKFNVSELGTFFYQDAACGGAVGSAVP